MKRIVVSLVVTLMFGFSFTVLAKDVKVVDGNKLIIFTLSDQEENPKYQQWWNRDGHIYKVNSVDNQDIDLTTAGDDEARSIVAVIAKPGEGNKINILLSGIVDVYGEERAKLLEVVNLDKIVTKDDFNQKTPIRVMGAWKLSGSEKTWLVLCDIKITWLRKE